MGKDKSAAADKKEQALPAKTEKVKKICQKEGNAVLWHFQ